MARLLKNTLLSRRPIIRPRVAIQTNSSMDMFSISNILNDGTLHMVLWSPPRSQFVG